MGCRGPESTLKRLGVSRILQRRDEMIKQEKYVHFNHTIVPYGDFFNPHARKDREKKKRLIEMNQRHV
jgi:hypothetical protein